MHTEKCQTCGRICSDLATYIHHDCEPYSWLDDSGPVPGRDYDVTVDPITVSFDRFDPPEDYYDED